METGSQVLSVITELVALELVSGDSSLVCLR